MSSTLIDFLLCGLAYLLLSYFLGIWTKSRRKSASDEGMDGKSETNPPILDLPPGITWPQEELVESE